jgi:hypothetical protein
MSVLSDGQRIPFLSSSTAANELSAIGHFLSWAMDAGTVDRHHL